MLWLFTIITALLASLFKMSSGAQNPLQASSPSYQAPLHNCNTGLERVPESYIVYLAPGYSLEKHSEVVGRDVREFLNHVYDICTGKVVYVGRPVDEGLLKAIRGDKGVEKVECEDVPQPDALE